jgi:hypothetical protein
MPRTQTNEEVLILRFFEDAPLPKAELLFNIVKEKMRARGAVNPTPDGGRRRRKGNHSATDDPGAPPQGPEST